MVAMNEDGSSQAFVVDLAEIRKELGLSQPELAALLAVSPRTVQSCEQGWRKPSPALEKAALLLLLSARNGSELVQRRCWEMTGCPSDRRQKCMAYSSGQGHLCWFLTGTLCQGERQCSWRDKLSLCLGCSFFKLLQQGELPARQQ
jgi:DNA-binding XRE family transcriptional regulator